MMEMELPGMWTRERPRKRFIDAAKMAVVTLEEAVIQCQMIHRDVPEGISRRILVHYFVENQITTQDRALLLLLVFRILLFIHSPFHLGIITFLYALKFSHSINLPTVKFSISVVLFGLHVLPCLDF